MLRRLFPAFVLLAFFAACQRPQRPRIGVVPKATAHLFFMAIRAGVNQAAQESQLDVIWNGPSEETDHPRQIQILDSLIAQRIDGIAISATDERALAAPVARALAAGIPVVSFDSGVQAPGLSSFIATDNHGGGVIAARRIAALVHDRGEVAMLMQKPGGTSTVLREQGFEQTLRDYFPQVRIVARQYGMADAAKSRAAAENILSAHPELDAIFASSEAASLGAIQALRARALSGKVRLVTFDSSDTHVEALRDGTISLMLVQDPYRIGYEAVKALAEKLQHKMPPARLDLPVREITRPDLDKPEIQRLLKPPLVR